MDQLNVKKEDMMEKRGQAAMEFLMTYGWAILAAVIAIGVLAYFGVFSPGKSMPDLCTINAPLGCEEFRVNSTDVRLIIRNGAGAAITTSNISAGICYTDTAVTIADGATADVLFDCTNTAGSKFNQDITVDYLKSGATIPQSSTGRITAQVA